MGVRISHRAPKHKDMIKLIVIVTVFSMTPNSVEFDHLFSNFTGCYLAGAYYKAQIQNGFFNGNIPDSVRVDINCTISLE